MSLGKRERDVRVFVSNSILKSRFGVKRKKKRMRLRDRQEDAASKDVESLEGWRGKLEGYSGTCKLLHTE